MDRNFFYYQFFENLALYAFSVSLCIVVIGIFARKISIGGLFDPSTFYLTFTFGTAYGIVLGLFLSGFISTFHFSVVALYAGTFIAALVYFLERRVDFFEKFVRLVGKEVTKGSSVKLIQYSIFILATLLMIGISGVGAFAEENRFEQNSGNGAVVRIFVLFRVFFAAHLGIAIHRALSSNSPNRKIVNVLILVFFWFAFALISSVLDGAKFAFLETLIASAVGVSIYKGSPLRFGLFRSLCAVAISLIFALAVYSINIEKTGRSGLQSSYISGAPFVVEALAFRVLANADKYFLSLPNDVIEEVEVKPFWVRIVSSMISATLTSRLVGYDVNDFSVGKQILYYWEPYWDIAGGPTSHFDLYSYKQFGFFGGFISVIVISWIMAGLIHAGRRVRGNAYGSSIAAVLLVRGWAIVIEPPLGVGYIFDVLVIFSIIAVLRTTLLRRV